MPYTVESPKPLDTSYDSGNFHYELEKRVGNIAMFKVTYKDRPEKAIHWEVIIVRVNKGGTMFGKVVEPYERYPSNNDFGRIGWGYQFQADADKKFDELVKSTNNVS